MVRGKWKCATITPTGQCVMIAGTVLMLEWSADSWDTHSQVWHAFLIGASTDILYMCRCSAPEDEWLW